MLFFVLCLFLRHNDKEVMHHAIYFDEKLASMISMGLGVCFLHIDNNIINQNESISLFYALVILFPLNILGLFENGVFIIRALVILNVMPVLEEQFCSTRSEFLCENVMTNCRILLFACVCVLACILFLICVYAFCFIFAIMCKCNNNGFMCKRDSPINSIKWTCTYVIVLVDVLIIIVTIMDICLVHSYTFDTGYLLSICFYNCITMFFVFSFSFQIYMIHNAHFNDVTKIYLIISMAFVQIYFITVKIYSLYALEYIQLLKLLKEIAPVILFVEMYVVTSYFTLLNSAQIQFDERT